MTCLWGRLHMWNIIHDGMKGLLWQTEMGLFSALYCNFLLERIRTVQHGQIEISWNPRQKRVQYRVSCLFGLLSQHTRILNNTEPIEYATFQWLNVIQTHLLWWHSRLPNVTERRTGGGREEASSERQDVTPDYQSCLNQQTGLHKLRLTLNTVLTQIY